MAEDSTNIEGGFYDDDESMIIPLSIDDIDATKSAYFLSTTKVVLLAVGIFPYLIGIIFIMSAYSSWSLFIFLTVLYLSGYLLFVRYSVFEEHANRASMLQLQANKYSNFTYFWGIQSVGQKKSNDGLLYLRQDGLGLSRAYVVSYDNGSVIGVPDNFYAMYRSAQQQFFRSLSQNKLNFKRFQLKPDPTTPKAMLRYNDMLATRDNDSLSKLIRLQSNNYLAIIDQTQQQYKDYYLISVTDVGLFDQFRTILDATLSTTLMSNGSFVNPHILDKAELDQFFANYYLQEDVNVAHIFKTDDYKSVLDTINIIRLVDNEGTNVPFEFLDDVYDTGGGKSVDDLMASFDRETAAKDKQRVTAKEAETAALNKDRIAQKITKKAYAQGLIDIEAKYNPATYNPNAEADRKRRETEAKKKERDLLNKQRRDARYLKEHDIKPKRRRWFDRGKDQADQPPVETLGKEIDNPSDLSGEIFDITDNIGVRQPDKPSKPTEQSPRVNTPETPKDSESAFLDSLTDGTYNPADQPAAPKKRRPDLDNTRKTIDDAFKVDESDFLQSLLSSNPNADDDDDDKNKPNHPQQNSNKKGGN